MHPTRAPSAIVGQVLVISTLPTGSNGQSASAVVCVTTATPWALAVTEAVLLTLPLAASPRVIVLVKVRVRLARARGWWGTALLKRARRVVGRPRSVQRHIAGVGHSHRVGDRVTDPCAGRNRRARLGDLDAVHRVNGHSADRRVGGLGTPHDSGRDRGGVVDIAGGGVRRRDRAGEGADTRGAWRQGTSGTPARSVPVRALGDLDIGQRHVAGVLNRHRVRDRIANPRAGRNRRARLGDLHTGHRGERALAAPRRYRLLLAWSSPSRCCRRSRPRHRPA